MKAWSRNIREIAKPRRGYTGNLVFLEKRTGVVCGMRGGVDTAATAALLLEQPVDAAKQIRRQPRDTLGDLDVEGSIWRRVWCWIGHRFSIAKRRRVPNYGTSGFLA